ncbi:MAG: M56 family metallopeptidase [Ruminococcaceae bacterium]|nr:M56 family metallopeptidase [Oscillospiraceae bacterium]
MIDVFVKLFNMSISASYLVLAVLLLRLLLKKAPKWINLVLWSTVAVRLISPFSFESVLSLLPVSEVVSPNVMTDPSPSINSGIPIINNAINPIVSQSSPISGIGTSVNPLQLIISILTSLWLLGVFLMLGYGIISYFRIKRRVSTAVLLSDNVYQCEKVISPFILGIIKPKIFIPYNLDASTLSHVLEHERAHVYRKDHLWKPFAFLLLSIYWFNPLMWLAFCLLCRDIELACDERVIKKLSRDLRADYSQALLRCSVNRRLVSSCPLAFGEVSVKKRVTSILNYKKPAFWLIFAAIVGLIGLALCFLTDPVAPNNSGIKSLSLRSINSESFEISLDYSYPTGGYSVAAVSAIEGEYCGDGLVEYDGSLGTYRLLVRFGDTEPSKDFCERFPAGKAVEIKSSDITLKAKRVHPEDHGFYLYLGFDTPITTEETGFVKFNSQHGSVKINVSKDLQSSPEQSSIIYAAPMYTENIIEEIDSLRGQYIYHRVFKKCLLCGTIIEATKTYLCQYNNHACEGSCLTGIKR